MRDGQNPTEKDGKKVSSTLFTQDIKYFGCKPKVHGRSKSELGSKPIVDQKTSENLTKSKSVVSKCKKDSPKTTPTPSVVKILCQNSKVVTSKSDSSQSNITEYFSRSINKKDKIDMKSNDDKGDKDLEVVKAHDKMKNHPEIVNLSKIKLNSDSFNEPMQTTKNEVKNGRNYDLVKSKDKNFDKIQSKGQNSKNISEFFIRADPAPSFSTSIEKLKILRSRDQSRSCDQSMPVKHKESQSKSRDQSTPVKPMRSQERIARSKSKIEREIKNQPSLDIFLSKRKERKNIRDIATCTPGKRKFKEIHSIFEPKRHKGGTGGCTSVQPLGTKPVQGASADQISRGGCMD